MKAIATPRTASGGSESSPLAGETASALLAPHDRVAAWLAASTPDPPPPHPAPRHHGGHHPLTWQEKARRLPGAGTLARLSPPGHHTAASPFAAHAASPFVDSPARPDGTLKGCGDDGDDGQAAGEGSGAGPASPAPALARLPNAAAAAAWAFSDGGGSDWGCNSSDSEWMRPGPAPGTRRIGGPAGPPPSEVLLPWDL